MNLLNFFLSNSERRVLDSVWRLGPIGRNDVAAQTGLTAMTVSRLSRSLEEKDLVRDEVVHTGNRGNPVRPLSINPKGGFGLGLNFTQTAMEVGLIDLSGTIIHHRSERIAKADVATLVDFTRQVREAALSDPNLLLPEEKIMGVGIALPGDFEKRGRILAAHALFADLRGRDLVSEFEVELKLPVYLNSDSNSGAVGERLVGAGRNFHTYFYVFLGHGVGGGLVINGAPYFGVNGNAGIIGVHFPEGKPRPSGLDYLRTLEASGLDSNELDFNDLAALEIDALPATKDWVRRAGGQLREKLRYVVRTFDPQAIIIGGRLPNTIHSAIAVEIDREDFCMTTDLEKNMPRPRVVGSMLGSRAGVIGAAALPVYATLFGL